MKISIIICIVSLIFLCVTKFAAYVLTKKKSKTASQIEKEQIEVSSDEVNA